MIKIIDEIFEQNSSALLTEVMRKFTEEEHDTNEEKFMGNLPKDGKTILRRIYVSEQDEIYFLLGEKLNENTLNEMITICIGAEVNREIRKSYRSNQGLLCLAPVDKTLTWEQRKRVIQVEESRCFCRKYVLWYFGEEKESLGELCQESYFSKNLNSVAKNYNFFSQFKDSGHKRHECLSRIYIRLPFMNLSDLETMDQAVLEVTRRKSDESHPELFCKLQNGDVESIEDYINLFEKEERKIQRVLDNLKAETK